MLFPCSARYHLEHVCSAANLYILMLVWLFFFSLSVFSGVLTPNYFFFFFVSSCIEVVEE